MTDAPENVADLMAMVLAEAGVERIFGYPGDPIIEFMERCRRRGVDVTLARREGGAGFMAEGWAMSTGRMGACLSTLGPGSTALVNPVAAATLDRVPVLAVSGQIDSARQAVFTHQVIEQERLFAPVTKWAARVEAGAVQVTMRKALRTATAERPGAVHLTVSGDTFVADVAGQRPEVPPMSALSGIQVASAVSAALDPAERLARARRPILLLGIGSVRCGAGPAALRLAREVGMPIVVSPMAKGVIAEDDEWFAGVVDMACNDLLWDLLYSSDLIIAGGFDPVELIKAWSGAASVMHIDNLANTDQVYPSEIEIIGDISQALDWLVADWRGEQRWRASEVRDFRVRLLDAYYAGRVEGKLNPTDVVDVASQRAARDTIVTTDVGSHKLLVGQGWSTHQPRAMLMTNGLSAMGFGIPAAIGAKLANASRPVLAFVGDGGFAMSATEIQLAVSLQLEITFIVFVDGSLNRIELKQAALSYPSTATRIEETDVAALAKAMGADGVRVDTVQALDEVLAAAAGHKRPLVVAAHVDPSQYHSQF